jgi:hypothetical protein
MEPAEDDLPPIPCGAFAAFLAAWEIRLEALELLV